MKFKGPLWILVMIGAALAGVSVFEEETRERFGDGGFSASGPEVPLTGIEATDSTNRFVASNALATLYHEIAHALIDVMAIAIYGSEEDAADVFSVLLPDIRFDDARSEAILRDVALGYEIEAAHAEDDGYADWGIHDPDARRRFSMICLFLGADPEGRRGIAADMGLPEERAETCEEERQLADDSWGIILDEIADPATGDARFGFELRDAPRTDAQRLMTDVLRQEVEAWNGFLHLPETITVVVAECEEDNAYYEPDPVEIWMCLEFADGLAAKSLPR